MTTAIALKDEIRSRSNGRKQATVDGLWQVLEEMKRKGIRPFTIALVGRHAEAAGVLRTQTLRNASGEDYRALINAFAQDIGVATTSLRSTKPTALEETIEAIPDLDVRTRLRMLLVENLRQREEIARLRQGFKHIQQIKQVGVQSVEVLPPPTQQVDIVPLEKFLSPAWIEERRWMAEPNGALYDETGECIAPLVASHGDADLWLAGFGGSGPYRFTAKLPSPPSRRSARQGARNLVNESWLRHNPVCESLPLALSSVLVSLLPSSPQFFT